MQTGEVSMRALQPDGTVRATVPSRSSLQPAGSHQQEQCDLLWDVSAVQAVFNFVVSQRQPDKTPFSARHATKHVCRRC